MVSVPLYFNTRKKTFTKNYRNPNVVMVVVPLAESHASVLFVHAHYASNLILFIIIYKKEFEISIIYLNLAFGTYNSQNDKSFNLQMD